jgi:glycosyltransferase involved in cell wall biosynthesis
VKTIVVEDKKKKGANWARNKGFESVDTEFVLFSDDDIRWREGAIEKLLETLEAHPEVSYSYGAYVMGGNVYCDQEFDPDLLLLSNYISTMSLIRTKDFPGFDESLDRFQDWDLWLTMLRDDKIGVFCGEIIFDTDIRDGITHNGKVSIEEAFLKIKDKHKL